MYHRRCLALQHLPPRSGLTRTLGLRTTDKSPSPPRPLDTSVIRVPDAPQHHLSRPAQASLAQDFLATIRTPIACRPCPCGWSSCWHVVAAVRLWCRRGSTVASLCAWGRLDTCVQHSGHNRASKAKAITRVQCRVKEIPLIGSRRMPVLPQSLPQTSGQSFGSLDRTYTLCDRVR